MSLCAHCTTRPCVPGGFFCAWCVAESLALVAGLTPPDPAYFTDAELVLHERSPWLTLAPGVGE